MDHKGYEYLTREVHVGEYDSTSKQLGGHQLLFYLLTSRDLCLKRTFVKVDITQKFWIRTYCDKPASIFSLMSNVGPIQPTAMIQNSDVWIWAAWIGINPFSHESVSESSPFPLNPNPTDSLKTQALSGEVTTEHRFYQLVQAGKHQQIDV